MSIMKMPAKGVAKDVLLKELREIGAKDADWRHARTWSLVYNAGEEVIDLLKQAYTMYFSENGLNPMAFPSLRKFETETVAMAAAMLNAPETASGNMTSGGTESILLAVKAAKERAKALKPHIKEPEMVIPISAHPAFMKASNYFDVKPVHAPLNAEFRADVEAMKKLVNDNTVLMVGSAPNFPYGVVDPITELSAFASSRGIPFHVDACVGGFFLPFAKKLGYPIPDFDFSVPGVTSMSADLHKYGYAAKGASTIIYRDKDYRNYQYYIWADWPGGVYASPTALGTRPGGAMAAAWAALNFLGEDGYMKIARETMATTKKLADGIAAIPGLKLLTKPDMSLLVFGSDSMNVFMLGDRMEEKGWMLDRVQQPAGLHMVVTVSHESIIEPFLATLREEAEKVAKLGPSDVSGMAAIYGLVGALPDRGVAKNMILEFIGDVYSYKK